MGWLAKSFSKIILENKQKIENLKSYFEQNYRNYVLRFVQNNTLSYLCVTLFFNILLNNLARMGIFGAPRLRCERARREF